MASKGDKTGPKTGPKKMNRAEQKRLAAEQAARKARRQWILIVGVGVLIVGGILAVSIWDARPREGDTSLTAWDLPARDNDADGDGRITLAEFAGKPTVVNFYADWCTACEEELPDFAIVEDDLGGEVNFVHVNTQETGDWQRFMQLGTGDWPIAQDINGQEAGGSGLYESVARQAGLRGMPVTAFYDANGRWVRTVGFLDELQLRGFIRNDFGIG
ncbi:MAG: TlpA disulfide reductase family protein [Actinomycetota bacterium]